MDKEGPTVSEARAEAKGLVGAAQECSPAGARAWFIPLLSLRARLENARGGPWGSR